MITLDLNPLTTPNSFDLCVLHSRLKSWIFKAPKFLSQFRNCFFLMFQKIQNKNQLYSLYWIYRCYLQWCLGLGLIQYYSVDGQWRLCWSITFFVLVDPYAFDAVKGVWIDQNKKGCGSTKTSLTVHTVCSKIWKEFWSIYGCHLPWKQYVSKI